MLNQLTRLTPRVTPACKVPKTKDFCYHPGSLTTTTLGDLLSQMSQADDKIIHLISYITGYTSSLIVLKFRDITVVLHIQYEIFKHDSCLQTYQEGHACNTRLPLVFIWGLTLQRASGLLICRLASKKEVKVLKRELQMIHSSQSPQNCGIIGRSHTSVERGSAATWHNVSLFFCFHVLSLWGCQLHWLWIWTCSIHQT